LKLLKVSVQIMHYASYRHSYTFVDDTFKVVKHPFVQLLSCCAFVHAKSML